MQDLVARVQALQFLLEGLDFEGRIHRGPLRPVHRFLDALLDVDGEALIEPEIAPGSVRGQVAGPGMRQFVRDDADQALVSRDGGRRDERQPRVLHAPVRERRRQHQDVVAPPAVRPVQGLRRLDHRLCVLELLRGSLDHAGLGIDAGALAGRLEGQIPDRQGNQVRRDRQRHVEGELAAGRVRRRRLGAHDHHEVRGNANPGRIRYPRTRCVLQRDPAAGVDRLGLAVEERLLATGGLARFQPLQPAGIRGCRVHDAHLRGCAPLDAQRRAQEGMCRPELEGSLAVGLAVGRDFDALDSQLARVEDEVALLAFHVQRAGTLQLPGLEVHIEVQVHVRHPHGRHVRVGMQVCRRIWRVIHRNWRAGNQHERDRQACETHGSSVSQARLMLIRA